MTRVKELWKLRMQHDFFVSGKCNYGRLVLSPESNSLLMRRQCRLMQVEVGEWNLICFNEADFDDSDNLKVDFMGFDRAFLYNTQWNWKADGTCPRIELGIDADVKIDMAALTGETVNCKQDVYFQLAVSLRKVNTERMTVAELNFTSKQLYWEYWVIPRDENVSRRLELEIVGDKECEFIRYDTLDNPLNMPAITFRSSVPLKLKEKEQRVVNLYEILPSGIRKPLMRKLRTPVPGQIPYAKEDTAIAVLYI